MMLDEDFARIRAHRNNIHRYRKLLNTRLSDLERRFIEPRLSEENSALRTLVSSTFPLTFDMAEAPPPAIAGAVS
jgi:hypothetical protein